MMDHNHSQKTSNQLIAMLRLSAHPEGGYYRRTYASNDQIVAPTRFNAETRACMTSIYYLLINNDFSTWHRINSDELWYHHQGTSVLIHSLSPDGMLTTHRLGNQLTDATASFQHAVPHGHWFAAELLDKNSFALVSCAVAPGFDFADFDLANADDLAMKHPQHQQLIARLGKKPTA